MTIIYSDGKVEFSAAIIPVFCITWSFRNHSNTRIWCSRNISYYYQHTVVHLKWWHKFYFL